MRPQHRSVYAAVGFFLDRARVQVVTLPPSRPEPRRIRVPGSGTAAAFDAEKENVPEEPGMFWPEKLHTPAVSSKPVLWKRPTPAMVSDPWPRVSAFT